LRDNRGRVDVK